MFDLIYWKYINSYLKLYTTMNIDKLATFMEKVNQNISCLSLGIIFLF